MHGPIVLQGDVTMVMVGKVLIPRALNGVHHELSE